MSSDAEESLLDHPPGSPSKPIEKDESSSTSSGSLDAEPEQLISVEEHILREAREAVPVSYKNLMKYSYEEFKGKPITVVGWARSVRKLKRGDLLFLQLYDGK